MYSSLPNRSNSMLRSSLLSFSMTGLSGRGAATYNVGLKHTELFSQFAFYSAAGVNGEFAPVPSRRGMKEVL